MSNVFHTSHVWSVTLFSFRKSYFIQIFMARGTYGSLKHTSLTHVLLSTVTNGLYIESDFNLKTLKEYFQYSLHSTDHI